VTDTPFWHLPLPAPDESQRALALHHQNQLTKPPGSLGRLEELAVTLCAQQGRPRPAVDRVRVVVFAADHGVCAEGISAFPQAVTGQMIANFVAGGAAVSVLARGLGAALEVVNLGTVAPSPASVGVIDERIAAGTANLARQPAMDPAQLSAALNAGERAVARAAAHGTELLIGGEMGIGNTTSAAAVACALLDQPPEALAGPGTGLNATGLSRKIQTLHTALARHGSAREPLAVLASLGGFEIAALAGALLGAAARRIPVLVDGFIVSVAALAAVRLQPSLRPWLHFAHHGAEPGHGRVLTALQAQPLLALEMRLGEGSGALAAVPLLRAACALHNGMASFADAGVSAGERLDV
jgi:nicotinate-nucleotide--dimethylbenzimidazole phosphoribosyltransferase